MKQIFLFTLLFILFYGCSPDIQVQTDYDPDYDLWTYKTFDWGQKVDIEKGRNPIQYNELNDKRIKSAVQTQLTTRGYQLSDTNPDLHLHYHIIVEDKSIMEPEPYGYNYSPYWMRMGTNSYTYREGTLILDLIDSKTHQLVWRGWAITTIGSSYTPEQIDSLVKTVVTKIFKKFPKTKKSVQSNKEVVSNNSK